MIAALFEVFLTLTVVGAVTVVSVRLVLSAVHDYRRREVELRKLEAEAELAEQRALNEALRAPSPAGGATRVQHEREPERGGS